MICPAGADEPEPDAELQLEQDTLLARTLQAAEELAALEEGVRAAEADVREPPAHLLRLAARLDLRGGLSGEQRIRRAYRLGRQDGRLVPIAATGRAVFQQADSLQGQRNTCYAVLRSQDGSGPHLASSRANYDALVRVDGQFAVGTVSRAFSSLAEARSYFHGVGHGDFPPQ